MHILLKSNYLMDFLYLCILVQFLHLDIIFYSYFLGNLDEQYYLHQKHRLHHILLFLQFS